MVAPVTVDSATPTVGSASRPASGTKSRSCGEFDAAPNAVIVHDPVEPGAVRLLQGITDAELQERYLFRERPNAELFAAQHRHFVEAVGKNVAQIHYLADLLAGVPEYEGAKQNPNQVYTRDALITLPTAPGRYIAGRMWSPTRQTETITLRAAAECLGLRPLTEVPAGLVLEGGDVIPFARGGRRCLLVGYGRRTTRETLDFLFGELVPTYIDEIIGVALAPWRINLDGGMVPVAADVVIVQPESLVDAVLIDATGTSPVDVLDLLREVGVTVLDVTVEESIYQQACNCLCLGDRRVICYDLCPRISELLHAHDVQTLSVPGTELVKGRGGPRCMSRPIYGA